MEAHGHQFIEKQNQSVNQFSLDLSHQAQGIYFIEVQQSAICRTSYAN